MLNKQEIENIVNLYERNNSLVAALMSYFQNEINRVKEEYAEETSKTYDKFEDKVKGFRDTTETQNSLLRAVEIEKSHLESQYLGYRQAVKDILGGDVQ